MLFTIIFLNLFGSNFLNYYYYVFLVSEKLANQCKDCEIKACIKKTVPIVDWLYNYEWKQNILGDTIAGVTVAVMHIPQGMFYKYIFFQLKKINLILLIN